MTLAFFISIFLLFVGLVITQELFARYPRCSLAFFSLTAILLFPYWIFVFGVADWFALVKVCSIAIGILLLSLFRATRFGNAKLVQWTTYILLAANILEAVARDVQGGGLANYVNVLTGMLLVATLDTVGSIRIDTASKEKSLRWGGMTLAWILGYTVWNWLFMYLNFGPRPALVHVAVLGSALVIAFVDKERWLQARVYTLATYFMIFPFIPSLGSGLLLGGQNETFGLFMSLITSGFMIAYSVRFFISNHLDREAKRG